MMRIFDIMADKKRPPWHIHADGIETGRPVKPRWADLITKIFGEMPLTCPKCGHAMNLKEFVAGSTQIAKIFPEIARAPPRLEFGRYVSPSDGLVYGCPENEPAADGFNQLPYTGLYSSLKLR